MLENIALLQAHYPFAPVVITFMFAALVGSFLNVVVYRLPIMMNRSWQQQASEIIDDAINDEALSKSIHAKLPEYPTPFNLVVPNSRCSSCNAAIKPWHNIPIIGYFIIGGKCASCSAPISARYPIVEFLTATLAAIVVLVMGPTPAALAAVVLTFGLITLALIDYDTQLLPDDITLPFLWLGLVVNYFGIMTGFVDAFLGAIAGYLILWGVFHLFKLVTGKEGMGYGDFKMLAMLGAWLGLEAIPLIIVFSSFAGAIIGSAMIAFGRDRTRPIKFGPFLAIAGWIALLWGNIIVSSYITWATG